MMKAEDLQRIEYQSIHCIDNIIEQILGKCEEYAKLGFNRTVAEIPVPKQFGDEIYDKLVSLGFTVDMVRHSPYTEDWLYIEW